MILSGFGSIAENEWHKSFEIRNELILGEFIMMPNHLHAIVKIDKSKIITDTHDKKDGSSHVETHGRASLLSDQKNKQTGFYRKPKSLSSFIAGYKSAVTAPINNWNDMQGSHVRTHGCVSLPNDNKTVQVIKYNRKNRLWQANYNDHIIRNENEYWRIKKYIRTNPENWMGDKFYK